MYAVGGGFWEFDVSDPSRLSLVSYIELPTQGDNIQLNGNIALVGTFGGLTAVDISTGSEPRIIGTLEGIGRVHSFTVVSERLVYAVGEDQQLWQVRIEGNNVPTLGSAIPVSGQSARVNFEGGLLFVSTWQGMWIMEMADPDSPQPVSFISVDDIFPFDVAVSGETAYFAERRGVRVVDISNPASPVDLRWKIPIRDALAVSASENSLVVAYGDNGFHSFDIGDRHSPAPVTSISTDHVESVVSDENVAYGTAHPGIFIFFIR